VNITRIARSRPAVAVTAGLVVLSAAGCSESLSIDVRAPATTPPAPAVPGPAEPAGSAQEVLQALPQKGRAPKTGYERDKFGPAWADVDRNGCDTRNDVLRRDLRPISLKPGTRGCVVVRGSLADPYTGRTVIFVRGNTTSTKVQIDHVVALSNAWQTGAQGWSPATRQAFANDPLNLLAVDGEQNQRKGDGDAATWLPPNRNFWCTYVARQVAVKAKYRLWVTPPERAALSRVLARCPGQQLPR